MLGKRNRPSFRRTSSMSQVSVHVEAAPTPPVATDGGELYLTNAYSGDYHLETPDFLRTCGLCNCRLVPGHDIYMYRGDAAFCSVECREEQMKQDERKERRSAAAKTKSGESAPEAETVAAAAY